MRDILQAVAAGELSPEAAEAQLSGYATVDAGRFDAARQQRSGVPEAILATGKTPAEIVTLAETSPTTGQRRWSRTALRSITRTSTRLSPS
jgi:NCAIR mutase (PurE)-related protein